MHLLKLLPVKVISFGDSRQVRNIGLSRLQHKEESLKLSKCFIYLLYLRLFTPLAKDLAVLGQHWIRLLVKCLLKSINQYGNCILSIMIQ